MLVIVPIPVTTPTMLVFVPPWPALTLAPLASLAKFTAPVFCLPAVESVVHDSLVELVRGARPAPGAIGIMAGRTRHARKQKHGRQRRGGQGVLCDSFYCR
jgi:hypothetical protein